MPQAPVEHDGAGADRLPVDGLVCALNTESSFL
jgi:hypothetical protein